MDASGDAGFGELAKRPMRVKVLYTFDIDSKTTCLARFPNTLDVPTVAIDNQSQVGVIELQQCVEAITAASPEILSKLESGDYTIYAYDYSEYETPLVGQGRLSTLLAASGSTTSQQNKAMITGRVCQNLPALFSNGVKETLEVKLRLTPVSRPVVREPVRATNDGPRSSSPATSAGFDPNAWNASVHHHSSDFFSFDSMPAGSETGTGLLEDIFGMGSEPGPAPNTIQEKSGVGIGETPTESHYAANPALSGHPHSAPGSRSNTPLDRPGASAHHDSLRHQNFLSNPSNLPEPARPDSRGSVRSEVNSSYHQRQLSSSAAAVHHQVRLQQAQAEDFFQEDGQSRKRAKVTQADWHGRSSFGARSSDLRITAATASSMHMTRPIAKRPSAPGSNLEPPPRVPTPVPQRTRMLHAGQPPINPRSMLRQASTFDSDFGSDAEPLSDAIMSSPEGSSPGNSITADGTPMDFPSSPPIISGYGHVQPSSPGLPALPRPRMADSGYMSEVSTQASHPHRGFEDDDDRSPDAEDMSVAKKPRARSHQQQPYIKKERSTADSTSPQPMDIPPSEMQMQMENVQLEMPGDMNRLPRRVLLNLPPGRQAPSPGMNAAGPPPMPNAAPGELPMIMEHFDRPEDPPSRRGSLALPPKPVIVFQSETIESMAPQKQMRRPLQRSRTGATDSEAGSPAPSDSEGRPRGNARSGSAAPRRKVIERRLQQSLASGEMPDFCSHCGAIETPTWRKLYVKYVDGKPSPLDRAEGEGEIIGVHTVETDTETGEVTRFAIRKMMKKTKDLQPGPGFEPAIVCNPCGLWFNKTREMRPSEKWTKTISRRRKRQRSDDIGTDGIEPESEAFFTDQFMPEDTTETVQPQLQQAKPKEPLKRSRSNSVIGPPGRRASEEAGSGASAANRAFTRAVQSSPVRFKGSQDTPIELDLTPNPTRRLLFPSPRQAGEIKSLDNEDLPSRTSKSPSGRRVNTQTTPSKIVVDTSNNDVGVFGALAVGKENVMPFDGADDLAYLFDGSPSAVFKTPQRKTPGKKFPSGDHLKTPTQSSGRRKLLSPSQNAANNANMNANDFMTSPSSSRYFLRSTPSRLERTPGGRSLSGNHSAGHDMTPFSRHLADMLNDAGGLHEAPFTSPSRQFDFTDLPTFSTPGRDMNWKDFDDILSSEFAPFDEAPKDVAGGRR